MPRPYPVVSFHFEARIAGDETEAHMAFAEVSGLDVEREVEEIREGGENSIVHRVPGRLKYGNLVLKRGIADVSDPLFSWCRTCLESDLGKPLEVRPIMVSLLDETHSPMISWYCAAAWPVKWSIASFDAMQGQVAMETLEFAHGGISRFRADTAFN